MKTISDHLAARSAERRAELITRAGRIILAVMIGGAAALIIGGAALIIGGAVMKAARIAAEDMAECGPRGCTAEFGN